MFGVISDTHYHPFTLFAGKQERDGCNERLKSQLDATWQAAQSMKAQGCTHIVHAGDMFHVRGSISPVTLNRVKALYQEIANELGLPIYVIAGNHDLETKSSVMMANASTALNCDNIHVVCGTHIDHDKRLVLVSWFDSQSQLMCELNRIADELGDSRSDYTVVIHAPLNSVIVGIPETGIEPQDLQDLGFGLVLSGHYHNHKQLTDNVFSVGALQHHNWGDCHSLAGYLLVNSELAVTHVATSAPKFIDFMTEDDDSNISGNYIRLSGIAASDEDIESAKTSLRAMGAKGVVCNMIKATTTSPSSGKPAKLDTLDASVQEYAKKYADEHGLDPRELTAACQEILDIASGSD